MSQLVKNNSCCIQIPKRAGLQSSRFTFRETVEADGEAVVWVEAGGPTAARAEVFVSTASRLKLLGTDTQYRAAV